MTKSLSQFLTDQEKAFKRNDLESVLNNIKQLFSEFGANRELHGQHIGMAEFDGLCQQAGQLSAFQLLGKARKCPSQKHHVIFITEIMCQGGHAELVRDIIRTSKLPVLILVSNINDRKKPVLQYILDEPNVLDMIDASENTLLDSLRTIQCVLANPAIEKIFLLTHGYDSVATAAISPTSGKEVLFFHHCDHYPALGCYLKGATHIDLHNIGFLRCRNEHNIVDNRYLCLSSLNLIQPRNNWRFANPSLKTASCGSRHKLNTLDYHLEYKDLVVQLLKNRNAVHFHIGNLTDKDLTSIYNRLELENISEQQFIYTGEAPNLPEILTQLEIDIYIPTLPQSGGKTVIDVMSAGIPIVAHQNARNRIFGSTDLIYPEAFSWKNFKELTDILDKYNQTVWLEQSKASLAYFEKYHTQQLFVDQLRQGGVDLDSHQIPSLKSWQPEIDSRLHYARLRN